MSAALITIIKIIGLFLLASLASEILVGAVTGTATNSTTNIVMVVIQELVQGIVSILGLIPVLIVNFGIALINGIFGINIDYLPYP
jgi:hypothetical protein